MGMQPRAATESDRRQQKGTRCILEGRGDVEGCLVVRVTVYS